MNTVLTVCAKEILEGIRDFRSVFISWILPLLLFPAVVALMSLHSTPRSFTIGTENIGPGLKEHLESDDHITVAEGVDDTDVSGYAIDVFITGYPDSRINGMEISYNGSVRRSLEALEYVKAKITEYTLNRALEGAYSGGAPVIIPLPVSDANTARSRLVLFTIVPLFMMVISVTSPIAIVSEIVAGEKERSSLEVLFSSAGSRTGVILGKYIAAALFGSIGLLSFAAGVIASFYINSDIFGFTNFSVTWRQALLIAGSSVLLCVVMSAVEVTLSLFARSTKESQLYIIPLSIVSIGLASFSEPLFFDSAHRTVSFLHWIPLVNIIHFIREVIMDEFSLLGCVPVLIVSVFLVSFFLYLACVLSGWEKILYRN
ncbi:MAG: ABC transporter permease [Spirochaetota bacterium]